MKQDKFYGLFIGDNGYEYEIYVYCSGFLQAFFLLTADAIRSGRHYQLSKITNNDTGVSRNVSDILKCSELLS